MDSEEVLSSSCSSTDEHQELQELLSTSQPSLNDSVVITGHYTPSREDPPVEFPRLIEVSPEVVRAQQLDRSSLNSSGILTDLMEVEDSSVPASSDSVQDDAPSEYVERTPNIDFDIDGMYDYEITNAAGKPYVPPALIPAYFTSRIHYGSCGRCTRAKDFGYEDWLKLECSGDTKALEAIGNKFCLLCGLDCVSSSLMDKHMDSIHELRGWFPRLEECPVCLYDSFFPGPPTI